MSIWVENITLEDLLERSKNTMAEHLGIEFVGIGEDFLVAKMEVDPRTRQPLGIMHGGASCALAETVGSAASNYCVNQKTHYSVGLAINTNHIKSIREGSVFATASPYHLGHSTQVWNIQIINKDEELISINRLTMSVLKRKEGK
jgi:1,4-dihydroxy-2-naphthoyl-CoA hydrolase